MPENDILAVILLRKSIITHDDRYLPYVDFSVISVVYPKFFLIGIYSKYIGFIYQTFRQIATNPGVVDSKKSFKT